MRKTSPNPKAISPRQGIGPVKLSPDEHGKLVQMAEQDERSHTDFVRWLLRREWERRNKKAKT